ncbi:hypothetical protein [Streptomyces echinatus]|uniref:hypothetical protein n=1 Tax=Streptomyces echinatus TaxID=67293 RepID=UPI0037FD09D2
MRVQVSSRLTWTFSVRAALLRAHRRHPEPVPAARLPVPAALLRSALRAVRPRAVRPRAARVRRPRRR